MKSTACSACYNTSLLFLKQGEKRYGVAVQAVFAFKSAFATERTLTKFEGV